MVICREVGRSVGRSVVLCRLLGGLRNSNHTIFTATKNEEIPSVAIFSAWKAISFDEVPSRYSRTEGGISHGIAGRGLQLLHATFGFVLISLPFSSVRFF